MKIQSTKIYSDPNGFNHLPFISIWLDFEKLKNKKSREIPGFNRRLLELFPGLTAHYCDYGEMGGFVQHLHDGTSLSHVVEHIAIEMLTQAGFDLRCKNVCRSNKDKDSVAIIETNHVETTKYLMPVAAEIVDAVVSDRQYFYEEKVRYAKELSAGKIPV